jgi:hypothetical protein
MVIAGNLAFNDTEKHRANVLLWLKIFCDFVCWLGMVVAWVGLSSGQQKTRWLGGCVVVR